MLPATLQVLVLVQGLALSLDLQQQEQQQLLALQQQLTGSSHMTRQPAVHSLHQPQMVLWMLTWALQTQQQQQQQGPAPLRTVVCRVTIQPLLHQPAQQLMRMQQQLGSRQPSEATSGSSCCSSSRMPLTLQLTLPQIQVQQPKQQSQRPRGALARVCQH
jgi:hypothetical protein